jgi:hypothetical protein
MQPPETMTLTFFGDGLTVKNGNTFHPLRQAKLSAVHYHYELQKVSA